MKISVITFFQLLPVVLSLLLLAAHFLRSGIFPLVIVFLLLPLGLFIRKPLVAKLFQIVLILGSIEWIRTIVMLISVREQAGQPWTRLAVILGLVTVFTFLSSFVFFFKRLKARYGLPIAK